MEKLFKIPILKITEGCAYIKADSLEDAISEVHNQALNGVFSAECDFDSDNFFDNEYYQIDCKNKTDEGILKEIEEMQNNAESFICAVEEEKLNDMTNEELDKLLDKLEKAPYCMTEKEFNALSAAINFTKIQFLIDQLYYNGKRVDIIIDSDDNHIYCLEDGIKVLLEALGEFSKEWTEKFSQEEKEVLEKLYSKLQVLDV